MYVPSGGQEWEGGGAKKQYDKKWHDTIKTAKKGAA